MRRLLLFSSVVALSSVVLPSLMGGCTESIPPPLPDSSSPVQFFDAESDAPSDGSLDGTPEGSDGNAGNRDAASDAADGG